MKSQNSYSFIQDNTDIQDDYKIMLDAIELAQTVRSTVAPNPWVGCVLLCAEGVFKGVTAPKGEHAEIAALSHAGKAAKSSTMYVTLEPCAHYGNTPPCTEAIIQAGVSRVVIGIPDPDPRVSGKGIAALKEAGIQVELGIGENEVKEQLAAYIKHRTTGRPWVILKLAITMDGYIAAPDGSSKWITGNLARMDVHKLRQESDAVLVGANTVRIDNPSLRVRLSEQSSPNQPMRIVLGKSPPTADIQPAFEFEGKLSDLLDELGSKGILQLLVEGGAKVGYSLHNEGLIDRYVFYIAPALLAGNDGLHMFDGPGAKSMDDIWRGKLLSITRLEDDLKIEIASVKKGNGEFK
ncbi:MAG: bifunctional diaminohydroxyphosphoribosylaminopyrimidine deaminase/5-amino-6-(5-phosphoribosylamino)uracil reductase RibD [Actinobacteria bacterium]|nr:bifunctional diaminohydroxyphosphoribosylaminopyrimidine deaminase/5-amino-6-(5-phosphoribosylamino)uracil reductase RibD [Actinomycetota bacterium]MCL6105685.1 bifunctional diaminohydroxyphosphoribosylaminopyrimidine deaminase/5-amino-6-(5-phosphoribosylamino)uracil reductase RibD [Actinomycetota bacterium]